MKRIVPISILFLGLLHLTPKVNAQLRLDSIVRYTYTSNGKDSLPVGKRLFDYNGSGHLSVERELESSNFVHWTDELRKKYIYDSKDRLERINKDSFISSSSTWKNHFYQTRTYSSDSDFVVRFYLRAGGVFDTLKKLNRTSLFADGTRKSQTKRRYDNFSEMWITQQFDSIIKDYHEDIVMKEYKNGQLYHYSGPQTEFFRLDSITAPVFALKYRSYNYELTNPPANKRIFISRTKKGPDYKKYYTSDSLVYFLNSNGLPDSSHKYRMFWNAPQFNGLTEKSLYSWKGFELLSESSANRPVGGSFSFYKKMDYSKSLGGLVKDTVFYKRDGVFMEKDIRKSTQLNKDGRIERISYSRWSSIVDSFSLNERDIYYYNDPATTIETKPDSPQPLSVFPNPTNGLIHLKGEIEGSLVLCDLQGRIIQPITPSDGTILISQKGIYLLKHPSSGQVVKIIVQ